MLGCYGCTTLSCYKDADEVVYYSHPGTRGTGGSRDINTSEGRGSPDSGRRDQI